MATRSGSVLVGGVKSPPKRPATHLTTGSHPSARFDALDGLRAIAAIGVVIYHGYPGVGFWMSTFVDLFFVISGFVITRMLLEAPAGHRVSLRNFWVRRVLRIWPVYYATLAGAVTLLVFYSVVGSPPVGFWDSVWKCFFFIQFTDLYGDAFASYRQIFSGYPIWLAHTWTLAVEEQFYVIWPLLVLWVCRRGWMLFTLCAGFVIWCLMSLGDAGAPILLLTRGVGLAMGSAFAVVHRGLERNPGALQHAIVTAACVTLVVCGLLVLFPLITDAYAGIYKPTGATTESQESVFMFCLLYVGLVGWVVLFRNGILSSFLAQPLLVYLGGLSYAIYMFHYPLMAVVGGRLQGWPNLSHLHWTIQVGYWVLLLAVAHLSRQWLEKPFNSRKHDYPLYVPKV